MDKAGKWQNGSYSASAQEIFERDTVTSRRCASRKYVNNYLRRFMECGYKIIHNLTWTTINILISYFYLQKLQLLTLMVTYFIICLQSKQKNCHKTSDIYWKFIETKNDKRISVAAIQCKCINKLYKPNSSKGNDQSCLNVYMKKGTDMDSKWKPQNTVN